MLYVKYISHSRYVTFISNLFDVLYILIKRRAFLKYVHKHEVDSDYFVTYANVMEMIRVNGSGFQTCRAPKRFCYFRS
jgi:hypothetical protein